MLTYPHSKNPERKTQLTIDTEKLQRASEILLGAKKTKEIFPPKTPKETLELLSLLWQAAENIDRNPTNYSTKEQQVAAAIKRLPETQKHQFRAMHVAPRIRGENQLRAIDENGINTETGEIRVSLRELRQTIQTAEKKGKTELIIPLPPNEPLDTLLTELSGKKTSLTFQDELNESPVVKRIKVGDCTRLSIYRANKYNTTPKEEILKIGEKFSGERVTISKNVQIETVEVQSEEFTRNGIKITAESCQKIRQKLNRVNIPYNEYKAYIPEFITQDGQLTDKAPKQQLRLSISFPEILQEIEENKKKPPVPSLLSNTPIKKDVEYQTPNPGEGMLQRGPLRLHTAEKYGCNAVEFIKAIPSIYTALKKDLKRAASIWEEKEGNQPNNPNIQKFLREYTLLSLTLTQEPKSISELGPNKTPMRDASNSTSFTQNALPAAYIQDILPPDSPLPDGHPNTATGYDPKEPPKRRQDWAHNIVLSSGEQWSQHLISQQIQMEAESTPTEKEELLKISNIQNWQEKTTLICENFYNQNLDSQTPTIKLNVPCLTDKAQKNFLQDKQINDDAWFNEKLEAERAKLQEFYNQDLWVRTQLPESTLLLPSRTEILWRLTKCETGYKKSGNGEWVTFGKVMKQNSRGDYNTLLPKRKPREEYLELHDLFTSEALNGIMDDKETITTLIGNLNTWQNYHAANTPFQYLIESWLNHIKKYPEEKIQPGELSLLLNPLIQSTGKQPFENEKTPDWMETPGFSSSIPLQLLCGVDHNEVFKDILLDPPKFLDLMTRWTNAIKVNPIPFDYSEPTTLQNLINLNEEDLDKHILTLELSEKPDFEALEPLGEGLPNHLVEFSDILPKYQNSNKTIDILGETTPIETLLEHLKNENITLQLNETNIENAGQEALNSLLQTFQKCHNTLEDSLTKTNKPTATINIQPPQTEEDNNLKTIFGEDYKESTRNTKEIATTLLAHNPQKITLSTPYESFTFEKGTNNTWRSQDPTLENETQNTLLAELQEIQTLISNPPDTTLKDSYLQSLQNLFSQLQTELQKEEPPVNLTNLAENLNELSSETQLKHASLIERIQKNQENLSLLNELEEAEKEAKQIIALENLPKTLQAIESLPSIYKTYRPEPKKKEDKIPPNPLYLLEKFGREVQETKEKLENLLPQLSDFEIEETYSIGEKKEQQWKYRAQILSLDVLNTEAANRNGLKEQIAWDTIQNYIKPLNWEGDPKKEKFIQTLITEEDLKKIAQDYLTHGIKTAKLNLLELLQEKHKTLHTYVNQTLIDLTQKSLTKIQESLEKGKSPNTQEFFQSNHSAVLQIKNAKRRAEINRALQPILKTCNWDKDPKRQTSTEEPKTNPFPNPKTNTILTINNNTITTNHLWVAGFLKHPKTIERIHARKNLALWLKTPINPKISLEQYQQDPNLQNAVLNHCKEKGKPALTKALTKLEEISQLETQYRKGVITEDELNTKKQDITKPIEEALESFEKSQTLRDAELKLAFLSYCHQKKIPSVLETIYQGPSTTQQQELKKAIKQFQKDLGKMNLPHDQQLTFPTLLHATAALTYQYQGQPYWAKDLQNLAKKTRNQQPPKKITIQLDKNLQSGHHIQNPYTSNLKREDSYENQKELVQGAIRSAAVLANGTVTKKFGKKARKREENQDFPQNYEETTP